jgi:hypothetical protein
MKISWIAVPVFALSFALVSPQKTEALPQPEGIPTASAAQDRAWDAPPDEFRQVERQGFHDGVEAAHHDFDKHRRADADDHDAYRHPPVSRDQRDDYRQGFRRGYERAVAHFNGEENHDHY